MGACRTSGRMIGRRRRSRMSSRSRMPRSPHRASQGPLDRAEPSLTFYLLATKEAPSVQATVGQFDSRFVISSPLSNGTSSQQHVQRLHHDLHALPEQPAERLACQSTVAGVGREGPVGQRHSVRTPEVPGWVRVLPGPCNRVWMNGAVTAANRRRRAESSWLVHASYVPAIIPSLPPASLAMPTRGSAWAAAATSTRAGRMATRGRARTTCTQSRRSSRRKPPSPAAAQ